MGVVVVVVVVLSLFVGPVPAAAGPPAGRTYRPPVDAPVIDAFRLPPEPWMAGNRGIEYATVPGTPVGAIGPGVVVFAGPVAGARYVTVRHPDGLRSSYSYLAAIRVTVGEVVTAGQPVGAAADRFHLGVRRGDQYLDPASLWGKPVGGGRVVLVPLDEPGGSSAAASTDHVPSRDASADASSRVSGGASPGASGRPSAGSAAGQGAGPSSDSTSGASADGSGRVSGRTSPDASVVGAADGDGPGVEEIGSGRRSLVDAGVELSATGVGLASRTRALVGAAAGSGPAARDDRSR